VAVYRPSSLRLARLLPALGNGGEYYIHIDYGRTANVTGSHGEILAMASSGGCEGGTDGCTANDIRVSHYNCVNVYHIAIDTYYLYFSIEDFLVSFSNVERKGGGEQIRQYYYS
jgi:hypothetical protein